MSDSRRYNAQNGGPAPEKLTNAIYEGTTTISKYYTADLPTVDTSKIGSYSFLVQHAGDDRFGQFTVEVCPADLLCWQRSAGKLRGQDASVPWLGHWPSTLRQAHATRPSSARCLQVIDPVTDYLKLLRSIFDFSALKALFARPDFKFVFDGLHGVAGPYAKRIFVEASLLDRSQFMMLTVPLKPFVSLARGAANGQRVLGTESCTCESMQSGTLISAASSTSRHIWLPS